MRVKIVSRHLAVYCLAIAGSVAVIFVAILFLNTVFEKNQADGRLLTVYENGSKSSFITSASTVEEALNQQNILIENHDIVEPALGEPLIASSYTVNIYRARPVLVVDGLVHKKTVTAYQSAKRIAADVGITLYPEDKIELTALTNLASDGAGLKLEISRATPLNIMLFGTEMIIRTHAGTVGEMLKEKGLQLSTSDRVSAPLNAPVYSNMSLRIWREGKQTASAIENTSAKTEFIYDADRPLGYRFVSDEGSAGEITVSYEIEILEGREVSRREISRIETKAAQPKKLVIGIKGLENGLTKNRGALQSTDSSGVTHRETYYDLPMNVVMRACGQGGLYTVRFDGMKIDSEGYIIVAANYALYPRCSVVETSAGPAKVYDTGGFVSHHPTGFDLATDWSKLDGI